MTYVLRKNCCDPPCPSSVGPCDDCGSCCCTEEFNPFPTKLTVYTYNTQYYSASSESCPSWPNITRQIDDGGLVTNNYGGDQHQEYLFNTTTTGAPGNFNCKSDGTLGATSEDFCDDLIWKAQYDTGTSPIYYASCNGWYNSNSTASKSLEITIHPTYNSNGTTIADNCTWYVLGLGSAGSDFFIPISPGDTTVEGYTGYNFGVGNWYWIITLTY